MNASATARAVLLGFDAREQFLDGWSEARRKRYLIVRDVRKPYSVDVLVWPSVFGDGMTRDQELEAGSRLRTASVCRGPNAPLWEDLEAVRGALAGVPAQEYTLIAVSEVRVDMLVEQARDYSGMEPAARPTSLNAQWDLLGYDVADRSLFSGLMDSSYAPTDLPGLSRRWAARLNAHHLFSELGDARIFAAEAVQRVPEHAPFLVFALHLVTI